MPTKHYVSREELEQNGGQWDPPVPQLDEMQMDDTSSESSVCSSQEGTKRSVRKFSDRIEDLKAYKRQHGHLNVRRSEDTSLADWVRNIKHARHNPEAGRMKLTADRVTALNAIGFDWGEKKRNNNTRTFAQRLEDLKAYKEEHSHLNVRRSENKSLADFCTNVRQGRKNLGKTGVMKLTAERIALLDAIGFDWRAEGSQVAKTRSARRLERETSEETSVSPPELPGLTEEGVLLPDRLSGEEEEPDEDFKPAAIAQQPGSDSNDSMNMLVDEVVGTTLLAFKQEPQNNTHLQPTGTMLGPGIILMPPAAKAPAKNLMPPVVAKAPAKKKAERGTYRSFSERIEDLKAFKAKNGHVNVSSNVNKSLAQFCSMVRHARKHKGKKGVMKLSDDRIAALDALNFDWRSAGKEPVSHVAISQAASAVPQQQQPRFKTEDVALIPLPVESSEVKPSANAPAMKSDEAFLKSLLEGDTTAGGLPEEEVKQPIMNHELELPLGQNEVIIATENVDAPTKSPREKERGTYKSFPERIEDLKAFKARHGHLNVSSTQDKSLAQFCSILRHARKHRGKKGVMKLSDDRIAKLDAIGFIWSIRDRKPKQPKDEPKTQPMLEQQANAEDPAAGGAELVQPQQNAMELVRPPQFVQLQQPNVQFVQPQFVQSQLVVGPLAETNEHEPMIEFVQPQQNAMVEFALPQQNFEFAQPQQFVHHSEESVEFAQPMFDEEQANAEEDPMVDFTQRMLQQDEHMLDDHALNEHWPAEELIDESEETQSSDGETIVVEI